MNYPDYDISSGEQNSQFVSNDIAVFYVRTFLLLLWKCERGRQNLSLDLRLLGLELVTVSL